MRKILLVIDMQNDFIDGSLGTAEAQAIVENVTAKMKTYPTEDIYATRDTHGKDYLDTQEGKFLPVEHCIKGTDGWQIREEIAELLDPEHIVNKRTFGSRKLMKIMRQIAEEEGGEVSFEIVGLCTDICVVSNALMLKAALREAPISVDPACCAGVTPAKHVAALETMRSCQIQIEG
ncbi:MAG: cysteine hydrolase [Lachnospiraceae bacterium]|nr:cysteine hydrolase [Lachnospiraceae bacterium]